MDRLAEMVRYVRQKNIDRYRKLLDEPTDPLRRQQLQQQLAELESDAPILARQHGRA
jgi:hypothetical protein